MKFHGISFALCICFHLFEEGQSTRNRSGSGMEVEDQKTRFYHSLIHVIVTAESLSKRVTSDTNTYEKKTI